MSASYELTGIVIQKKTFGENDLLITIFSPEAGLVRAVAPGARKHKSRLRGRTELLVINNFFLIKGRNLDRVTQIETIESHPKLCQSIGKLTVSQYLAELVLNLALTEQPQGELYSLLTEHLSRIENLCVTDNLFPYIAQAVFHLLAVTGVAPNVYRCVETQQDIKPEFDKPNWNIGFSFQAGGMIANNRPTHNQIDTKINALELACLQSLTNPDLSSIQQFTNNVSFDRLLIEKSWIRIERLLKNYAEYYLGKMLKSADIVTDVLLAF